MQPETRGPIAVDNNLGHQAAAIVDPTPKREVPQTQVDGNDGLGGTALHAVPNQSVDFPTINPGVGYGCQTRFYGQL